MNKTQNFFGGVNRKYKLLIVNKFTLIELLIVVAILAILAGMLLPALNSARNRGTSIACLSNQKQTAMVCLMYADTYDQYFPTQNSEYTGKTQWGCRLVDAGLFQEKNWQSFVCSKSSFTADRPLEYRHTNQGFAINVGFIKAKGASTHVYNWNGNPAFKMTENKASNAGYWLVNKLWQHSAAIMLADAYNTAGTFGYFLLRPDLADAKAQSGYMKDAHAVNACNMAFWDGHAAAVSPADLDKLLPKGTGSNALKNSYWKTYGTFAR